MLTAIVSSLGETQMAAHQIAIQVIHFSFLPTVALAEAGSVLAGQAVGAGRDLLVRRVAKDALIASSLYTGFWTLLLVFFGTTLVSIFTDEPGLAGVALSLLRVAAFFQIADGAATVARGVLRGAGDVVVPARLGVFCAWLCTPPLAYLLGRVMGLGALGGWLGLLLEISVLAALCWHRLRGDAWLPLAAAARARLRNDDVERLEGLPAE
jgi:MATE family multidrug resistance protein